VENNTIPEEFNREYTGQSWQSKKVKRIRRGDEHPSRTHPENMTRGEACWNAVLTMEKARDIRERVAKGIAKKFLAREYGVDPSLIRQICRGEIWKENNIV
jgi:ribosome-binding protein aMBF1 (putative translation factor)